MISKTNSLGCWRNKGEYLDTKKNSFKKVT